MIAQELVGRLNSWWAAALQKLKTRNWRAWAVAVGIFFIIAEAVRAYVSNASTLLVEWLFGGLVWITAQPMGVGGFGLFVYCAVLATVAWFETHPRRQHDEKISEPVPLSDEERRVVQDLRTAWNRNGVLAITQLKDILQDRLYELREREFWAGLLDRIVEEVETRRNQFETVLDPASQARPAAVRSAFNAMYAAYIPVMKWVAVLQARNLVTRNDRLDERLAVWRQNHRDFVNRLQDLNEDPAHRGTLKIFLNWIDDPAFRLFMRDAETSPEWLALIRESEERRRLQSESAGAP